MTSSLPVTFLTVQKSKAAISTTKMKVRISSPRKAFKNMKQKMLAPLNPTWNMHAIGFFAVENMPSPN